MKYTLKSAVLKNPDKEVYLIGDSSNKHYEKYGVIHHYFTDYLYGEDLEEFEKVFQYIVGADFNRSTYGEKWTQFNFRKWFVLANFLGKNDISSLWIFDSDVIIIEDLTPFEKYFIDMDYTTANKLHQLFGYVKHSETIRKFAKCVVELFKDEKYLEEQRQVMIDNPDWGLTMMRAFQRYQKMYSTSVLNIFNKPDIFPGIIFLDFNRIGLPIQVSRNGNGLVNLFINNDGLFIKVDDHYYRAPLMNMSWMPHHLMKRVFQELSSSQGSELKMISFHRPLGDKLLSFASRLKNTVSS